MKQKWYKLLLFNHNGRNRKQQETARRSQPYPLLSWISWRVGDGKIKMISLTLGVYVQAPSDHGARCVTSWQEQFGQVATLDWLKYSLQG